MSEGRELACALHFQLEGAVQLVGALGGCILVARLIGDPSSGDTLQDQLYHHSNNTNAAAPIPTDDGDAADEEATTASEQHLQRGRGRGGPSSSSEDTDDGVDDGIFVGSGAMGKQDDTKQDAAGSGVLKAKPQRNADARTAKEKQQQQLQSFLSAQFRCVALSGRTQHKAFAHESMLTGVMESRMALNIAVAGEPLLVLPLVHPNNASEACVGVLCLAYKAHPEVLQFDEGDEANARVVAGVIAMTLHRCHAARYVEPYRVARLQPLGLQTCCSFAPVSMPSPGWNPVSGASSRGLVYRSSSRAALSKRIASLHGELIPSLPSLMDIAHVMRELDALVLRQQDGLSRQEETQHVLERRLRGLQQDFSLTKITAERDKRESEAFRLAGALAEARLRERIAKSEVEKLKHSPRNATTDSQGVLSDASADVTAFLKQAKAIIAAIPGAADVVKGQHTHGRPSSSPRSCTFRGQPCPPPMPRPTQRRK